MQSYLHGKWLHAVGPEAVALVVFYKLNLHFLYTPDMQSYLHGKWLHAVEPEAVALGTSYGYETPSSKTQMRLMVLVSDLLSESCM